MSTRFKHIFEEASNKHFFTWRIDDGAPDPELIEFVKNRGEHLNDRWKPTRELCAWLVERDKDNSVLAIGTERMVTFMIADHDLAFEFKMKYC